MVYIVYIYIVYIYSVYIGLSRLLELRKPELGLVKLVHSVTKFRRGINKFHLGHVHHRSS